MNWTCRRARIACAATSSTSSRPSPRARRFASSCSTKPSSRIALFDPLTGEIQRKVPRYTVYPGSHYVTPKERVIGAIDHIREELRDRLKVLREQNKLVEAQRLEQRTMFDMEMMREVGYCSGIENYSRYLSGRAAGRAATVPVRLSAGERAAGHRRDRTRPFRSSAPCTRATARARRRWWNTASACRARSTTGRSSSRSGSSSRRR